MRAGRTLPIYCGRQPAHALRHRHGPVFYRQLFKIKTGSAFTDMHARRRIKSDIRAKIIQRLLKIDGFENGVAGVKFTTAQKCAAMGFLFQRQKGI
ncbi:Uncharacterised protein [Escherichia coli]|nr:Uncharacterised protein [Escherichia coli]